MPERRRQLEDSLRRLDSRLESVSATASHSSEGLKPSPQGSFMEDHGGFWTESHVDAQFQPVFELASACVRGLAADPSLASGVAEVKAMARDMEKSQLQTRELLELRNGELQVG